MCSAAYIRPIRPMHFRIIMTVSGVRAELGVACRLHGTILGCICGQAERACTSVCCPRDRCPLLRLVDVMFPRRGPHVQRSGDARMLLANQTFSERIAAHLWFRRLLLLNSPSPGFGLHGGSRSSHREATSRPVRPGF